MANLDLEKFGKVAGLLASDHDGERATAALMATRLLGMAGMSWADLVDKLKTRARVSSGPIPVRPRSRNANDGRTLAAQCAMVGGLTKWERDFCGTIAKRGLYSAREREILEQIRDKVSRACEQAA